MSTATIEGRDDMADTPATKLRQAAENIRAQRQAAKDVSAQITADREAERAATAQQGTGQGST